MTYGGLGRWSGLGVCVCFSVVCVICFGETDTEKEKGSDFRYSEHFA